MKHRVVSVGADRAATRLLRLVAGTLQDNGVDLETATRLAAAVVQAAHDEGFALTWQTSSR